MHKDFWLSRFDVFYIFFPNIWTKTYLRMNELFKVHFVPIWHWVGRLLTWQSYMPVVWGNFSMVDAEKRFWQMYSKALIISILFCFLTVVYHYRTSTMWTAIWWIQISIIFNEIQKTLNLCFLSNLMREKLLIMILKVGLEQHLRRNLPLTRL